MPSKWCTITIYVNGAQKLSHKHNLLYSAQFELELLRGSLLSFHRHCQTYFLLLCFFFLFFFHISSSHLLYIENVRMWWQMRAMRNALPAWNEMRRKKIIVKTKLSNFLLFVFASLDGCQAISYGWTNRFSEQRVIGYFTQLKFCILSHTSCSCAPCRNIPTRRHILFVVLHSLQTHKINNNPT